MPAAIAANAHQGVRSEYLAQYVFSAFGTAVPVPHSEDSGIDLYCTLGQTIGKRFVVSDYFLVQVKSKKEKIIYKGEDQVSWLLSHNYPLIYCFVNKVKNLVEIYQSSYLLVLQTGAKSFNSVTLVPDFEAEGFELKVDDESPSIPLGKPILSFKIEALANPEFVNKSRELLKSWVRLDQENINFRSVGFTMFRYPDKYKSNQDFSRKSKLVGTFRELDVIDQRNINFHDALFRLLSIQINRAVAKKDFDAFKRIELFARSMTDGKEVPNCIGHTLYAICFNTGLNELGMGGGLVIKNSDGSEHFLKASSVRN